MSIEENSHLINKLLREITIKEQSSLNEQLQKKTGLTTHQVVTLQLIENQPGLIQKDIVAITKRRAATVSVFLKKLEKAELIIRKIPADNSRNKEIYLTATGQQAVDIFRHEQTIMHKKLTKNLTLTQQKEFIQLLTAVKRGLEK